MNILEVHILIGFFGFSESFQGLEKLPIFKDELEAVRKTVIEDYSDLDRQAVYLKTLLDAAQTAEREGDIGSS